MNSQWGVVTSLRLAWREYLNAYEAVAIARELRSGELISDAERWKSEADERLKNELRIAQGKKERR